MHKSWLHEGGISSPMIVHWPKGIQDKNKLRHNPAHLVDVLPTLVQLAGGNAAERSSPKAPERPGKSLAAVLHKDGTAPHEYLYFNHNSNRALRVGNQKLVSIGENGPWELYDLASDRCEQNNLASQQADTVRTMAATWKAHDDAFVRDRESATETTKLRMRTVVR
ncbi:MAG: sulfatase-like hydrolase/transferase [Bryobacteraceae bacterium]|nr:sulfatase-like hydrolase/transferase [Bryobacteraceae bacterium]